MAVKWLQDIIFGFINIRTRVCYQPQNYFNRNMIYTILSVVVSCSSHSQQIEIPHSLLSQHFADVMRKRGLMTLMAMPFVIKISLSENKTANKTHRSKRTLKEKLYCKGMRAGHSNESGPLNIIFMLVFNHKNSNGLLNGGHRATTIQVFVAPFASPGWIQTGGGTHAHPHTHKTNLLSS